MTDSDSSSQEEICQEGAVYNNSAIFQNAVCGTIEISGHLHIEHFPCHDQGDEEKDEEEWVEDYDDDDSHIQEHNSNAEEDTKQEEIKLEKEYNTAEFEAKRC